MSKCADCWKQDRYEDIIMDTHAQPHQGTMRRTQPHTGMYTDTMHAWRSEHVRASMHMHMGASRAHVHAVHRGRSRPPAGMHASSHVMRLSRALCMHHHRVRACELSDAESRAHRPRPWCWVFVGPAPSCCTARSSPTTPLPTRASPSTHRRAGAGTRAAETLQVADLLAPSP